ncbi:MAG: magnesium transporter [Faecousia sp.]
MKKLFDEIRVNLSVTGDTVGVLMCQPVVLPPDFRVDEAIARIRQVDLANMNHCYVVEENGVLLGMVSLRALLMTRGDTHLKDVMTHPFVTLQPEDDQELASQLMQEYDLLELPVVDRENRLIGVVTADDAMAVLQEEATEDMERMAAMSPSEKPYLESSVLQMFSSRIVWLLLLMISAVLTGGIISYFEDALAAQVALTAFIPMLMDTGGNCGSQSSVTVIRSLSLGEIVFSDWFRVLWKELRVSILCALVLAAVNCVRLLVLSDVGTAVALTVSLTLAVTVILADLVGGLLPLLAKRLGFDPAVMASPLITTIVDALSLLVYFRLAVCLLGV